MGTGYLLDSWTGGGGLWPIQKCKGLPLPPCQIRLSTGLSGYHVTLLFHVSSSQRFHFCHYFFSEILVSSSRNLDGFKPQALATRSLRLVNLYFKQLHVFRNTGQTWRVEMNLLIKTWRGFVDSGK